MTYAIVGGRDFTDYSLMCAVMSALDKPSLIVSGGARGADKLAELYAFNHGIPFKEFPADWSTNGKAAGMLRNKEIVAAAEYVIAFWDKKSKGTRNTIELCVETSTPCKVFTEWEADKDFDWSDKNLMFRELNLSKVPKLIIK